MPPSAATAFHADHDDAPAVAWPSPFRLAPRLLIIGAAKSGTTSLYEYMCEHHAVRSRRKELNFFSANWTRGIRWYARRFPRAWPGAANAITIDASPDYLLDPRAPDRVARTLPNTQLIAMLRDPVARAYSEYQHNRRLGRLDEPFADLVERELDRFPHGQPPWPDGDFADYKPFRLLSHLERGRYAEKLRGWLERFPPERLLVMHAESFYADPQGHTDAAFAHVGLPPHPLRDAAPRNTGGAYDRIDTRVADRLREHFRPLNAALGAILNQTGLAPGFTWPEDGSWPEAQPVTFPSVHTATHGTDHTAA